MQEYKFRGKTIDNNEWVYGNLIIDGDKYYICLGINEHIKRNDYEVYMIEVIPETVLQALDNSIPKEKVKSVLEREIKQIKDKQQYNWVGTEWNETEVVEELGDIKKELLEEK